MKGIRLTGIQLGNQLERGGGGGGRGKAICKRVAGWLLVRVQNG